MRIGAAASANLPQTFDHQDKDEVEDEGEDEGEGEGEHSASEMMGTSTISFPTLYLSIKDFS